MKKLIAIVFAASVGMIASAPASAVVPLPTPEDCAEADTAPPGCPAAGDVYPVVEPEGGTVPDTPPPTTAPPVDLPKTGSSGTTVLLQIGTLLLTGGLIVIIATRRRTADSPATG